MNMHQAHTGALVGQTIHRNGRAGYRNALPLLSEEDVPGYVKLEKHSVDQLRRLLACRGIKKSWSDQHCSVRMPDADSDTVSTMPKLS